jgi:hypothetical protein
MIRVVPIVIAALAGPARAQGFEKFVADLASAPAAATKRLASCEVLVAPSGDVRRPCALALGDLVSSGGKLVAKNVKQQTFPNSLVEWVEADVDARDGAKVVATYHVVEVGGRGNPDGPDGGWIVRAQHWSRTIRDTDALALAKAGKLPSAPAIADAKVIAKGASEQERADLDSSLDSIKRAFGDLKHALANLAEDGGVVIGSAPGEHFTGKAGGKSLRGWKLELAQQGGIAAGGGGNVVWAVTHVIGTTKDKPPIAITYVAFAVWLQALTPEGGSFYTKPVLVQFAIPQAP